MEQRKEWNYESHHSLILRRTIKQKQKIVIQRLILKNPLQTKVFSFYLRQKSSNLQLINHSHQ